MSQNVNTEVNDFDNLQLSLKDRTRGHISRHGGYSYYDYRKNIIVVGVSFAV